MVGNSGKIGWRPTEEIVTSLVTATNREAAALRKQAEPYTHDIVMDPLKMINDADGVLAFVRGLCRCLALACRRWSDLQRSKAVSSL